VDHRFCPGQADAGAGVHPRTLPEGLQTLQSQGKRHDIVQLGGENLAAGLNGEALFLFASDQKDADALNANPLLAHLSAVQNKRVYALGAETFRLDYYSATRVLARLSRCLADTLSRLALRLAGLPYVARIRRLRRHPGNHYASNDLA
jgi:ABC-type Fe2+-enterobactin transport system substrate-binding protein